MRALLSLIVLCLVLNGCSDFFNSDPKKRMAAPPESDSKPAPNPFAPGLENPNEGPFSEEKMLVNTGVNVVARAAREFRLQAELLKDRAVNHCRDLSVGGDVSDAEVKAQWERAMMAFHFLSAVPVGPLTDNNRSLFVNIYAWPLLNVCGIDQEVVRLSQGGAPRDNLPFQQRGLGALEYLLFENEMGTRCNPNAHPRVVEWTRKPALEKRIDRCRFVAQVATDVAARAQVVEDAWATDRGNFTKALVDGSRYPSLKDATNDLTDALFSIEKVKDARLGKPLGRHRECVARERRCPEMAEHAFSGAALKAVIAQLRGFQAGFFGHENPQSSAFGLDDLLKERGHGQIARDMAIRLEKALASARELAPGPALQILARDLDVAACAATTPEDRRIPVCALHQDVRAVSTVLRAEVLAVLALRTPPIAQGDND